MYIYIFYFSLIIFFGIFFSTRTPNWQWKFSRAFSTPKLKMFFSLLNIRAMLKFNSWLSVYLPSPLPTPIIILVPYSNMKLKSNIDLFSIWFTRSPIFATYWHKLFIQCLEVTQQIYRINMKIKYKRKFLLGNFFKVLWNKVNLSWIQSVSKKHKAVGCCCWENSYCNRLPTADSGDVIDRWLIASVF